MDTYMDVTNFEMTGEKDTIKDFFVISADCRMNEPNDLWATRIDKNFRDRVPTIKVDEKGRKWFVIEGLRPSRILEAPKDEAVSFDEFRKVADETGKRPRKEKAKVLGLNSAKLFNIEVPAKYR